MSCTAAWPTRCGSGGYLVVGATERIAQPAELGLELAFPFVYRKA